MHNEEPSLKNCLCHPHGKTEKVQQHQVQEKRTILESHKERVKAPADLANPANQQTLDIPSRIWTQHKSLLGFHDTKIEPIIVKHKTWGVLSIHLRARVLVMTRKQKQSTRNLSKVKQKEKNKSRSYFCYFQSCTGVLLIRLRNMTINMRLNINNSTSICVDNSNSSHEIYL